MTIRYGDTAKALGNLIKFAKIGYGVDEEDSNSTEILFKLYLTTIRIVEDLWEQIAVLARKILTARIILFLELSLNDVPLGDRSCVGRELLNFSTWHQKEVPHGI